jgi:hypothetical protein
MYLFSLNTIGWPIRFSSQTINDTNFGIVFIGDKEALAIGVKRHGRCGRFTGNDTPNGRFAGADKVQHDDDDDDVVIMANLVISSSASSVSRESVALFDEVPVLCRSSRVRSFR